MSGARRRQVAVSGHTGDLRGAREGLSDDDASVRATALGALARLGDMSIEDMIAGLADGDPVVRRRACELAAGCRRTALGPLTAALDDSDDRVVEAACYGLGELAQQAVGTPAVTALASVTISHRDALCRETAVAALGAIGDPAGLDAILAATTDKAAVRRRAVLALAPFEGPRVDAALTHALTDRDWQVRQAAEDLSGELPGSAPV